MIKVTARYDVEIFSESEMFEALYQESEFVICTHLPFLVLLVAFFMTSDKGYKTWCE